MTFLALQVSSKSNVVVELDKAVMSAPRLGRPNWATMLGSLYPFRLLGCRIGWSRRESVWPGRLLLVLVRCIKYDLSHNAKMILYHNHVMEMSEHFNKITFHYILRDENQMADALATLSAMLQVNEGQEMTIHVWRQSKIAHYQQLDQDEAGADNKPWYHDIKKYLEKGVYLERVTENDKRTLRRLTDLTLLRCINNLT
ncbi:hypothetical protein CR513_27773, partial [Mucuna pruriens]